MACDESVPPMQEIWLEMAQVVAKRSRCTRRQIGCVLVRDGQIIGLAHNGPQDESPSPYHCPRGALSYAEQPADINYEQTGCLELHAEELALSRSTVNPRGATLYINTEPCPRCARTLAVVGVKWVVQGVAKPQARE